MGFISGDWSEELSRPWPPYCKAVRDTTRESLNYSRISVSSQKESTMNKVLLVMAVSSAITVAAAPVISQTRSSKLEFEVVSVKLNPPDAGYRASGPGGNKYYKVPLKFSSSIPCRSRKKTEQDQFRTGIPLPLTPSRMITSGHQ